MERIQTFVSTEPLTPPSQIVRLPAEHFTREEREQLLNSVGMYVLLNTSAGWWRFFMTEYAAGIFTFKSSGAPGEHVTDESAE